MDASELATLGERLEERHRRLLFELAFETAEPAEWEEASSCLAALERRRLEAELRSVQTEIEALKAGGASNGKAELARLLERKQALRVSLERMEG